MAANPSIQLGTDGNWAIKEDNLLAYKKDGTKFFNKEFDFTRGSFATFVDKDGLIKASGLQETNLVQNGDFATSLSYWLNSNNHWQWTSQGAYFPLISTHQPLTQILNNSVGVKLKITFTLNIVQGTVNFYYKNTSNSSVEAQYTQSGTYTLITEPVKQNTNINFTRYGGINTEFYLNNVSAFEIQLDIPRIDFTNDTKGHLLLEPQSTNVLQNSEITSTWTYTEYGSGSTGTITTGKTDMFGGTNAAQIDFPSNAENVTIFFGQTSSSISSGSVSGSIYIKLVESGSKTLQLRCSPTVVNTINVNTTEFVRYQLSGTKSASEAFSLKVRPSEGTSSGGFSIIVCQPQEEALSYATSYIPTFGSTATRIADICNNSGSVQDFNSEEGVLYADIAALANDGTSRTISLSKDINDRIQMYFNTSDNSLKIFYRAQGTHTLGMTEILSDATEFNKIAFKWKTNDFALWVNGTETDTVSSGVTSNANTLNALEFEMFNDSGAFYGKTKNLKVFKRAMSDGELYLLTVPQYQSYQEMATALNYTL